MNQDHCIPLLTQISRLRMARAHTLLSTLSVHPSQFFLLSLVEAKQDVSQAELAKMLLVKPPSLTVMLQRMVKNDLIYRYADADDARVMKVTLTDKGRELLKEGQHIFEIIEKETYEGFSDQEIKQLHSLLERIQRNFNPLHQQQEPVC
ncbi:MAG: MarR family winged helix-turn-helix transcriptional regulator [Sphaerochaetaceae bacterium]|jgi:DNA-binding MarR family transcriptional regulator